MSPAYSVAQSQAGGEPSAIIAKGENLSLQKCVEIALERQPAIRAAANSRVAAESRVGEAKAGYYPQINLSGVYTQARPMPASPGFPRYQSYQQYSANATLSQTIFDFGKTPALVDAQKYGAEAAGYDEENARNSIVYGVNVAYYSYLQSRRNVAVGRETVSQFKNHLDVARSSFEVGTRPRYDVTKAEVDLSNAKLALIHAENYQRLAKLNLDNAMGVSADYDIVDDLSFQKVGISAEDAVIKAIQNRPDLRALEARTNAAEESVEAAKSGYYPSLSGSAQYSVGDSLPDGWNVGLTLTVPFFSGFSTVYTVRESRANREVLSSNAEQLRLSVYNDVQQAYLSMMEAEEKIPSAELSVKLARENMEIAEGRYKEGVGTPIEVTDAQVTFSNARTAQIQSLVDYKLSRAALEKAIGGKQ
jgi:TolC family type I secretion outer membrane protein